MLSDPRVNTRLLQLHMAHDIPAFWSGLQSLLKETVSHDALVVYLNFLDFAKSWKAEQILTTPNARRPAKWFEERRRVDMTPEFVLSQPHKVKLYRLSDVVPDPSALKQTEFFRHYFAPGGWHHFACMMHWRGPRVGSQIAIRRTREQGDFSADECARIRELYPHIETVLGRLLDMEEDRARRNWMEQFNQHLPFAFLFLNWDLEPVFVNRPAMEQCALWNFGIGKARAFHARSVFHLPADLVRACTHLKAGWLESRQPSGPKSFPPRSSLKIVHPEHAVLTATISLQVDPERPSVHPGFVIYLENSAEVAPDAGSLSVRSLMAGLTETEREVSRLVCEGLANKEIAERSGKSVKTVKAQLSSVYRKLGVSSRSQLLALAAGRK